MAVTPMSDNLNIIAALADEPNATSGLTAAQLKAKFDEGPGLLKTYVNATIVPGINNLLKSQDTRDVNGAPSTYPSGVTFEMKSKAAVGLPAGVNAAFVAVMTFMPYVDNTGNAYAGYQLAHFENRLFTRMSVNDTTWGAWQELYGEGNTTTRPHVYAWKSGATPAISASAATKLLFQTEVTDDLGEYNPATSLYTAKKAGWRLVNVAANFIDTVSGEKAELRVYINGAIDRMFAQVSNGASAGIQLAGSVPVYLNANDYIEIYVYLTAAAARNVQADQYNTWFRISPLA